MIWFFNRYGEPQLILTDQNRFIDKQGNHLGYVRSQNQIYNYNGRHCGWIEGFVIRDSYGHTVGFSSYSQDYPAPIFPIKRLTPLTSTPKNSPLPKLPQLPKIKPIKTFGWSPLSLTQLFN